MGLWGALDAVTREVGLFAAVGLLVGGLDDLAIDLVYFARLGWRRLRGPGDPVAPPPARGRPMRFAVFIPAWDEARVIGAMLRATLARWGAAADVRLYVGAYPNDWDTVEAIAEVAEHDRRVRLVVGTRAGPTTKADCLNTLWRALRSDEAHLGERCDAIVLHDAEDVVHRDELAIYAAHLADHDAVQLPVLPLPHARSRWIGGTYLDEFAEAHVKQLAVRQALGAAMPFAGVGCAIRHELMLRIAAAGGGQPFHSDSLTEDYELGLKVGALGGRTALALVDDSAAGRGVPAAVRAFFPATLDAAVRQKARWMTGIALSGWDRTGWSRLRHLSDHWMRMRDRRALLAVLVLLAAYAAILLWSVGLVAWLAGWHAPAAPPPVLAAMLLANLALLAWRAALRAHFTARVYGRREGARAVLRMPIGNVIALVSARRAMAGYLRTLRGLRPGWDKTEHEFPADAELAR